ncbi:STAS-like domain-containing protein [Escherichia coli]|uniref:STAS-like domain-containing protein n=1 Tax=Escherichia coli TaxID=562 RepID=UPI002023351F|nr:DUF4325 domain-containing protein [Escherichia coli]
MVDFRGIALGVGSSFLEEAFGGLIRKEGIPKANVKARLIIKSDVRSTKNRLINLLI